MEDLTARDAKGNVSWKCHKCQKVFIANCGLDILKNGVCVGYKNLKHSQDEK